MKRHPTERRGQFIGQNLLPTFPARDYGDGGMSAGSCRSSKKTKKNHKSEIKTIHKKKGSAREEKKEGRKGKGTTGRGG